SPSASSRSHGEPSPRARSSIGSPAAPRRTNRGAVPIPSTCPRASGVPFPRPARKAENLRLDEPAFSTRIASDTGLPSVRPLPVRGVGLVHPVLVGVVLARDLFVAELLLGVRPGDLELRDPVDH